MIEWIVILGIIFCIIIWYYSQSAAEYGLAQITESQVGTQLEELWQERKPVVISDIRPCQLWVAEGLRQTRFWGAQPIWESYEKSPSRVISNNHALEMTWAQILGIHQMEEDLLTRWFNVNRWIFSTRSEAHIGGEGLRQTWAYATSFTVTDGEGRCILLHSGQKNRLPPGWNGLRWKYATVAHHPLWTQVQCIEVILRPGTSLVVPPHWIVAVEPLDEVKEQPVWWVRTDLHHPISSWAQRLNEKDSNPKK